MNQPQPPHPRPKNLGAKTQRTQLMIEQIALLVTSFIWTTVALSLLVFFWVYQDLEASWEAVIGDSLSEPGVDTALAFTIEATATPTPWQGPPPSTTPTETLIPTATSTWVIQPPELLPETLNLDEPTPIPVIIHSDEEIGDYIPTPVTVNRVQPSPTATPTAVPTNTASAPPTHTSNETLPPQLPTATPRPTSTPTPSRTLADHPSRLEIPSVLINVPVIPVGWRLVEQNGQQYSIWDVADYAVGWHNTSATLGQVGNTVMAGHHNINGEVFRDLVNVEVGDEVIIHADNTTYTYRIELKTIVKEKGESPEVRRRNAQWIAPTTDERITMVTCWPYTNNTHRVIVVAKPTG